MWIGWIESKAIILFNSIANYSIFLISWKQICNKFFLQVWSRGWNHREEGFWVFYVDCLFICQCELSVLYREPWIICTTKRVKEIRRSVVESLTSVKILSAAFGKEINWRSLILLRFCLWISYDTVHKPVIPVRRPFFVSSKRLQGSKTVD